MKLDGGLIEYLQNPPASVVVECMLNPASWTSGGHEWLRGKLEEMKEQDHGA